MADRQLEVFVATFGDEEQGAAALKDFQAMDREGSIELIDAAVRGAIAGGLVGLIFPPSLLASAAVGAAGGGVWGKVRDKGFQDDDLKAIGENLEPGTSAIIAIAEDRVIEQLQRGIEGYRRIARHGVSAEASAAIVAEVEERPRDSAAD